MLLPPNPLPLMHLPMIWNAISIRAKPYLLVLTATIISRQCSYKAKLSPCLFFRYVYFARPDSVIDGVSVYQSRMDMGVSLAEKIKRELPVDDIDVVMPIPDTSWPSARWELAVHLEKPYREGLIKKTAASAAPLLCPARQHAKISTPKLSPMETEFNGKSVLLVDDSIVRGTTSRENR